MEHFADLFVACYVGRASIITLETIAPNAQTSVTHPATSARVQMIEDFLAGRTNPLLQLFQACLQQLQLPPLQVEFRAPNIGPVFDDVRTYDPGLRMTQTSFD
jgi:hypothetical protein